MRATLSTCAIAAVILASPAVANESLLKLQKNPENWVMQLGNYAGHRFSPLKEITPENVRNLQVAWQFSTGVLRGHEGGPLVVGDVMYVHTPWPNNIFALDMKNFGRIIWSHEPQQDPRVVAVMCCDTVNRGPIYADGKIIFNQADNVVKALDAKTGKVLWEVQNGDFTQAETMTMSPLVVKDKVIVGNSGGEFGVRGHITAYDLNTGKLVWRAFSTGPDSDVLIDPEKTLLNGKPIGQADLGIRTWPGNEWQRGGGTVWGFVTYDPELDLIYYGTGNPGTWNPAQRVVDGDPAKSDNKWSMTLFARDPDTGMAAWAFQKTPFDEWDYDGINEPVLADLDFDGQKRQTLVNFDRNGYVYVLDRESGELISVNKYDQNTNWAKSIDPKTGRPEVDPQFSPFRQGVDVNTKGICPAALGSKDQQPVTFSPETGLFYVPMNKICMDYEPTQVEYTAGQPYVGATVRMYPAPGRDGKMGEFKAWDPVKGQEVWSRSEDFAVWSGALSTAGGVVFYGTLEGFLVALDKKDGRELWRFKTPSGIIGYVSAFEHDNRQHIAVLSGVGGWAGIGLAAGLTEETAGLGAVGAHAGLRSVTNLGGVLTVFSLEPRRDVAAAE
jgi:PQQ-dependent dehydrogenase (methanol/ethanol family)